MISTSKFGFFMSRSTTEKKTDFDHAYLYTLANFLTREIRQRAEFTNIYLLLGKIGLGAVRVNSKLSLAFSGKRKFGLEKSS